MSAPTAPRPTPPRLPELHLREHDLDSALPPRLQALSLAAELDAAEVFRRRAATDLLGGDLRAVGRLAALAEHTGQLRAALDEFAALGITP